ncbi:MAG: hypothetical protein FP825_18230 [Hyphomonas sp.]|uniref:hypothetical protein n=1 Tax=Hyphomonas sp. TaxID=87 RepID=UPI0017C46C6C|nr:hypothetical protein [Hyphomonas sp.]MBU3921459.1 hypothetical protein [Alphaproteobacteria bacterium]MBA3070401.1 hypothetical protein [Hyphomonas sp.]MBU4062888.1 hypothetical protein [Alphaproteobacteria bacterium]MBU4163807.1 hypothetical protein [Alphaproteobacteria bacterium]MBU4567504.1 hypothetical protein [Alphaproteobacteria bacterium]
MSTLFWILVAGLSFAVLLAAQMRILLSIVLRRALADKFGGKHTDARYRTAIYDAGRTGPDTEETGFLSARYPQPLAHLTLARRVALAAPALLLLVILAGRFAFGVI